MTNTNLHNGTSKSQETDAPKLLIFGNPLLDVTVQMNENDNELLRKYNLEKNGQAEVPLDKLNSLFNEARERYELFIDQTPAYALFSMKSERYVPLTFKVIAENLCIYKTFKFSLGGSGLNSARILGEALGEKNLRFFGAIGNDKNGKLVRDILKRSGVDASLQELEIRTGTVVCLCQGSDRSLVANIGAALKCEKSYVEEVLSEFTTNPKFYYIEGFFIPEKMDICRMLYEKYSQHSDTLLITNLNAPYIIKTYQKDITWMTSNADIIFGNRDEFEELATINGFGSMDELFTDLFSTYSKGIQQKIVVVTDGANDVLFYKGNEHDNESGSVNVPMVDKKEIIDTTGAGDSFVAGFIYELIRGKDIRECIEFGVSISSEVIRTIGCNLLTKRSN